MISQTPAGEGLNFADVGRERTKNFNPRRTLLGACGAFSYSAKGAFQWFFYHGDVMPLAFHPARSALSLCVTKAF